jgi:hypothetical protein
VGTCGLQSVALARAQGRSAESREEEPEPRRFTPELGLLGAILRGALEDVTRTARSYREIRAEAHALVFDDDLGGLGWSFEQVCTELDLDAERIRVKESSGGGDLPPQVKRARAKSPG